MIKTATRNINKSIRLLNSYNSNIGLLNNNNNLTNVFNNSNNQTQQIRNMSFKNFMNPFKYYKENADTQSKRRVKKELESGVLWDVKEYMKNPTMKIFVGSPNLIAESQADIFPTLKSKDLNGNKIEFPKDLCSSNSSSSSSSSSSKKEPTLLIVSLKPYHADKFISSWSEPFKKEFPQLNVHSVFLIGQFGYQLLSPLLKATRKGKNNDVIESWSNQPLNIKQSNTIYEDLGISNQFSSYIYLVYDGKIRWKSSGLSTPNELDILNKLTKTLISE